MNTEQELAQTLAIDYEIKQTVIDGRSINYLVAGSGAPLLLIHGSNIGWGAWYPNIPQLTNYFTVYAIDLLGAGRSSRIDFKHLNIEKDLFDPIYKFISEHHLKDVSIIGSSIGGWIALRLALLYPKLINKIVLENSIGFTQHITFFERMLRIYPLAMLLSKTILKPERKNNAVESFLRSVFNDKKLKLENKFVDYFYDTLNTSHSILFLSRLMFHSDNLLLSDQLANINTETLIIWGMQDKIVPLHKNRPYFDKLPNKKVIIQEHVGHIPSMENSDAFNTNVINFLTDKY